MPLRDGRQPGGRGRGWPVENLEELRETLEARKLIERAKSVLMEREGLTEPEAFRRLQAQSMKSATPMRALAEAIVLSTQALGADPPSRTGA
jgi:AmiR/NasT family two-component response regulator